MSHFDKPKFQNIIQFFLNSNCDLEEQILSNRCLDKVQTNLNSQLPMVLQKSMRLFIIEIIPSILVSDGHNFIEAVFTKESINEFRKNHSHVKFSSLRDKVIYVSKWRLQLDNVDSRKVFNSFNNLSIKIIVEAFKPIMYETLNQRLTHGSTSVFRDPNIQVLIKSFRHWFSQIMLDQSFGAIENSEEFTDFPSVAQLTASAANDSAENQNEAEEQENSFGANIQNTQVFRVDRDFKNTNDIKIDSFNDMVQFSQEVVKKRDIQIKDIRLSDLDRIIVQEKGEQFYAEKKFSKSRQWQDTVEDEWRREQLRLKLEYFQISQQQSQEALYYETKWQNEERQKSYNRSAMRSTRRIAGYTLGNSVQSIKEKLVRLLTTSKFNTVDCGGVSTTSPIKGSGRPRSNSQENILQLTELEDSKSNLLENQYMKINKSREPLSQFVQHKMPVFNDDTQSENDSMDEMKKQIAKEAHELKHGKSAENQQQEEIDEVLESTEDMSISLYRQYLDWFTQNELIRIVPIRELQQQAENVSKSILSQNKIESEVTKPESCENPSAQMTISPPKFSAEQTQIQQDIEMIEDKQQPSFLQQISGSPVKKVEPKKYIEYNEETESIMSNSGDSDGEYKSPYTSQSQNCRPSAIQKAPESKERPPAIYKAPESKEEPVEQKAQIPQIQQQIVNDQIMEESEEESLSEPEPVNLTPDAWAEDIDLPEVEPVQNTEQQLSLEAQNTETLIEFATRQSDLELDLSIIHQKQQINNQVLIQTNKKLTDKTFKLHQLNCELPTFEQLIVKRLEEFEILETKFLSEYQLQKENIDQEKLANEQFDQQLIEQDENKLAELANLSELDQQIQSMEIDIAKKTREMQGRIRQLNLIKRIKIVDEEYQASKQKRVSELEEKQAELNAELSKTCNLIPEAQEEITKCEIIMKAQNQEKRVLNKEQVEVQKQIQVNLEAQIQKKKKEEQARLVREAFERENQEKINKEKIRREQVLQEQIQIEQALQEKIRIEQARQEKIRIEQARQVEIARQEEIQNEQAHQEQIKKEGEEQKRLQQEKEEQQRLNVIEQNQAIANQPLVQTEQEKQLSEEKKRRIEIEKRKMIMIQQQRMRLEQIEKQRQQMLEQEKEDQEEEEAQKTPDGPTPQGENEFEEDDDLDWQEGAHNERSYDEEEEWKRNMEIQQNAAQQERQKYIDSMGIKFASGLNKEIRKCETRDLARRDIKSKNNNDKLHDFMQIKKIKQDKLDQQRRQLQDENSSSAPESKEDSLKDTTDDQKLKYIKDCSNFKKFEESGVSENQSLKSSSRISETVSGDENVEKYNLFDNDNKQQNETEHHDSKMDEISSDNNNDQIESSNVVQKSMQSPQKQVQTTFQSPQKTLVTEIDAKSVSENDDLAAMKAQIEFLKQSLMSVTQQLQTHQFSQQGNKQASPLATLVEEQVPAAKLVVKEVTDFKASEPNSQDDDYLLPSFGSQIQQTRIPTAAESATTVNPFTPNRDQKLKRTFSEMENQTSGMNALTLLADQRRIEEHKRKIEHEKKKKYEREMQLKHQVRKSIGHPNPELHQSTQSHNNQQSDTSQRNRDRQRARSQSQDRQQPMQNPRSRTDSSQVNNGKSGSSPQRDRRPVDGQKQISSDPNGTRHGGQMMGGANRMDGPKRHLAHSQYTGKTDNHKVKNTDHHVLVQHKNNDIQKRQRRYSEHVE